MGSNSSSNAPPQETQSAPVTARSTPNQPKRNRNFQEVQIGQAGTTPRSKQPERNRGPSPKPHQSTSTRGQDPGASGGGSDKKTAQQTPRQGAAANGGKQSRSQQKQNTMPSQQSQQKQNMMPSQQTSVRANKEVSGIHDNKGSGAVNDDPNDPMVNDLADPDKKKNVGGFHGNGTAKRNEIFGGKVNKNAIKNNANPSSTSGQKGKSAEESKKSLEKSSENKTTSNSIVSKKDEEKKKTVEALDVGGKQGDKLKAGKHLSVKFKEETIEIPETPTTIKQNDKQKREENELKKTSALNSEESKSKNDLSDKQDKSIADKKLLMDSVKKKMLNTRGVNGDIVVNTYQSHHEFDTDNISYDHGSEIDDETHDYHGEMDGVTSNQTDFYDDESHGDMSIDETGPAETINDHSGEVLQMKDDDLVFETFYHRSGKEFQCIYQSGMRFYLDDWGSKEWQPFPKRWYNEGLLVTNTILKDDSNNDQARNDQSGGTSSQGQSTSRSQGRSSGGGGRSGGGGGGGSGDDREGFLMHPSRGRVPTYIFYKKHNVHMYFDKDTGSWVRLPIGWELHHNMVKSLVDQVEEALPSWNDRHDILSLLRACNYDPDECISIYLHLEKDEWFKAPRTAKEGKALKEKENQVTELEKKVRDLEIQLEKERTRREEAERNVEEQTTMMSEMEAESKQTEAQLSAVTGGRPKSARPVSRMVKAGKGPPTRKGVTPMPVHKGENVNPEDIQDLNANAMELRKSHTRMKMEVERYMGDFKHILEKVGPAFKQLKSSEKGTQNEIEEVRALYRKEALQRKLLYNQLQELRGNIRVFCRVRKDDRGECCIKFPSDQDMIAIHPQQGKKMFSFDKVFGMGSTQEQVFEDTKPIITSCADGYNVCLLAYGQTGSGKTFTMMGPESNPGINIRAMKELFNVCDERKETMKYNLTVSLVEIYNETIQDLLTNDAKTLELRTAGNKVNIPGLIEYPIKNVDDVKKVMAMGDKNRSVASTKMNSTSSRSHLVLMLTVEGHDKVTSAITRGTLVLCDLAGSERIGKTEAEGQRLVEAAAINKSLSALGQVFSALRSSQLHVPYRNSKLTQILQPSLGGDAKACLFVNVSPDLYNFAETVSTLSFGNNARQVALGQAKQNISKGNR